MIDKLLWLLSWQASQVNIASTDQTLYFYRPLAITTNVVFSSIGVINNLINYFQKHLLTQI